MKRCLTLLFALVLALGLVACSGEEDTAPQIPAGTAVEVMTVTRGDLAASSTVTGNVVANRDVPVMPPVAGKVKEVKVSPGDAVQKGDVLFVMDTADLRDTYDTLLTSYESTKTMMDEQVRQAQQALENAQALYEMGAVSRNSVEQAQLRVMQAETSRTTTLAQMGIDDVVDVLNDPNVYATIDGTVTSVAVTGGVMTSNTTAGVVVSEIGKPQAVVNVSETLQPFIAVGQQVDVTLSTSGETVTGTVASVAGAVSSNTALYQVNIDLPEDLQVSIGMFATVKFLTDQRQDVVLIPSETILTEDGQQYVYIVTGDAAFRVDVTTGLVGASQTEITSGLQGGEQLVVRGQTYLSDGATVRIVEGTEE